MALDCDDAALGGFPTGFPFAQPVEDVGPVLSVTPWPCPGYDQTYDFSFNTPASPGTWDVVLDLGVGAFGGNPYLFPGFPAGVFGVSFESLNAFKAHIILDAWFGINPGTTVTVTFTLTEVGGTGRVYQNSLGISDAP